MTLCIVVKTDGQDGKTNKMWCILNNINFDAFIDMLKLRPHNASLNNNIQIISTNNSIKKGSHSFMETLLNLVVQYIFDFKTLGYEDENQQRTEIIEEELPECIFFDEKDVEDYIFVLNLSDFSFENLLNTTLLELFDENQQVVMKRIDEFIKIMMNLSPFCDRVLNEPMNQTSTNLIKYTLQYSFCWVYTSSFMVRESMLATSKKNTKKAKVIEETYHSRIYKSLMNNEPLPDEVMKISNETLQKYKKMVEIEKKTRKKSLELSRRFKQRFKEVWLKFPKIRSKKTSRKKKNTHKRRSMHGYFTNKVVKKMEEKVYNVHSSLKKVLATKDKGGKTTSRLRDLFSSKDKWIHPDEFFKNKTIINALNLLKAETKDKYMINLITKMSLNARNSLSSIEINELKMNRLERINPDLVFKMRESNSKFISTTKYLPFEGYKPYQNNYVNLGDLNDIINWLTEFVLWFTTNTPLTAYDCRPPFPYMQSEEYGCKLVQFYDLDILASAEDFFAFLSNDLSYCSVMNSTIDYFKYAFWISTTPLLNYIGDMYPTLQIYTNPLIYPDNSTGVPIKYYICLAALFNIPATVIMIVLSVLIISIGIIVLYIVEKNDNEKEYLYSIVKNHETYIKDEIETNQMKGMIKQKIFVNDKIKKM